MSAAEVRELLARHGLAAHRSRGQNFLCDAALAARLVDLAGIGPDDSVIEIGTGLGILSRALAARARRVVSLEVDAGLVRALQAESLLPENVELRHADVLQVDLRALAGEIEGPLRLVANLPYSISAPVLRRLLDLRERLDGWSLMLQREMAARVRAPLGSRDYGSLAVLHALCCEVQKALDLGPGCFHPAPQVRSVFLNLAPLAQPLLAAGPQELAFVERVVRAGFEKRRKTWVNALREAWPALAPHAAQLGALLVARGYDPRARAEALAPADHLALARALRARFPEELR